MKTYTAIEIHELAKHICSEYWRRAEIPGEQRSIPDLYAESFGEIILRLQDELTKCRTAVAAERGMVVPPDAPRMWAVKTSIGAIRIARQSRDALRQYAFGGDEVVRVAIVEVKE